MLEVVGLAFGFVRCGCVEIQRLYLVANSLLSIAPCVMSSNAVCRSSANVTVSCIVPGWSVISSREPSEVLLQNHQRLFTPLHVKLRKGLSLLYMVWPSELHYAALVQLHS